MTARISIFDIPLLLDTICILFPTRDSLVPCLLVCRHWHDCFLPQVHRFVELDNHRDDIRIGDILYQAQSRRLRSLDTDIVDVGYFLHSEECVSLEILRCGNYEEVSLAKRLTKRLAKEVGAGSEELGLALGVATVETEAEFRRLPIPEDAFRNGMVRAINASNSTATNVDLSGESEDDDDDAYSSDGDSDGDKDTTALPPPFSRPNVSTPFRMTTALIARNLHLRILEFTNDCLEQDCDDVIPDMAPLIPRLVHLTKLKIQVILGLHEEFLASILCSLPESMQDVEIKAPKLLPPQRSIRRSRYPRIARKSSLCRLCLDPCGFEDFVGDDDQLVESNVMMFILKTIERSPRLVELELLGQHYKGMDVLRALSWHCPEIERLSLRVAFHHLETIMGIHGPPLLRLREVHIEGYIDAITMGLNAHEEQYRRVLPDFLRRSYKTLEVLTVEAEYSGRIACDVAFETEAWNFWRGCPRLRRYSFRLSHDWGTTAPRHHQLVYLVGNVSNNNSNNNSYSEDNKLSSTWACLELEELDITIHHTSSQDCRGYSDPYHYLQFLSLISPLYQQLRLLKRLEQPRLGWEFCGMCEFISADRALEFINASETNVDSMTIEDTTWMGLPWRK